MFKFWLKLYVLLLLVFLIMNLPCQKKQEVINLSSLSTFDKHSGAYNHYIILRYFMFLVNLQILLGNFYDLRQWIFTAKFILHIIWHTRKTANWAERSNTLGLLISSAAHTPAPSPDSLSSQVALTCLNP